MSTEEPPKVAEPEQLVDATKNLAISEEKSVETSATPSVQEKNGVILEPFPYPLATCKPEPPAELSETEVKKYESLLENVKGWTDIPTKTAANSPTEPLTEQEKLWLTRDCLLRYLRATKWDADGANKRLLATLAWRREYGIAGFTHDYISPENETGKQVILGYDNEGRPCLYLNPSKQNTERSDRQLQHLFYNIERVVEIMPPGQENLALVINFSDTKRGQGSTIAQARETMYVLQNHYPERLGRALITELPWYIRTFFNLISPFIDPHTRTKMKFNEPLSKFVPAEQLLNSFGGKVEFEYKHDIYWPSLYKLCTMRREDYYGRWVKAGKQIGEHELYLRGGDAKCMDGTLSGLDLKEGFSQESK